MPFSFPNEVNGISLILDIYSSRLISFPDIRQSKLSSNSFGNISYRAVFSTTMTGALVIGSFKKFPVSIIAFMYTFFESIINSTSQIISFLLNFPFMFLNAVTIMMKPAIPPVNMMIIGYVPINVPVSK